MKIYGIKNCNSVKKALDFLDDKKIPYEFIDYKKHAADEKLIKNFIAKFSLEKVLNKKGTSFKKLNQNEQALAEKEEEAINFMIKNNSLIKRPIILDKNITLIGFDEDEYKKVFSIKNYE